MVRVLVLISQRNFSDDEFLTIKSILEENKIHVIVASTTKGEAIGIKGAKVNIDNTITQALKENYDAIIVIGGPGSPSLSDYPEVIEILKINNNKGKIIAAISLAPVVLGKAGLLKNIMTTVFPVEWAISSIINNEAHYFNKDVVEDGNIITANDTNSSKKFINIILKKLKQQII